MRAEMEDTSNPMLTSSNSIPHSSTCQDSNHQAVKLETESAATQGETLAKQAPSVQDAGARTHCFCLPRVKLVYVLLSAVILVEWAVLTLPISFFHFPTNTVRKT